MIIVGEGVTNEHIDAPHFRDAIEDAEEMTGLKVEQALADSNYSTTENLEYARKKVSSLVWRRRKRILTKKMNNTPFPGLTMFRNRLPMRMVAWWTATRYRATRTEYSINRRSFTIGRMIVTYAPPDIR
jgi:hypothetical protein